MKLQDALLRSLRAEFSNPDLAKSFSDRSETERRILLGDNGRFWVMSNRVASVLLKNGFEEAEF